MLKILRRLLGLCVHDFRVVGIEDVKWRSDQYGRIIDVDMSHAGVIHHRNYTIHCMKCPCVKVKRIKI